MFVVHYEIRFDSADDYIHQKNKAEFPNEEMARAFSEHLSKIDDKLFLTNLKLTYERPAKGGGTLISSIAYFQSYIQKGERFFEWENNYDGPYLSE